MRNPIKKEVEFISTKDQSTKIEGMELVWSDEFDVDGAPNPANWSFEYGFKRNQELQWYQAQNATCKDGLLIIESKKEKIDNPNYNPLSQDWRYSREYAEYSSSCLISRNLQEWQGGGYYEIRARVDTSKGSWPAIWLLGTEQGWPECGEIDMMEFYRINKVPTILANVAWGTNQQYKAAWDSSTTPLADFISKDPDWSKKFHTWSMKWDNTSIQIFLDGELLNEVDLSKTVNPDKYNPFTDNKNFYLLLNLAIGSNGGDPSKTSFPLKFEVDYVRVYKYL
ncbi:glycoside hydrolase family 16 protein [Sunxiuqinia indica]|uniref:glycoside hydrolase family 16 protein n=1 Tax=Sunxiuqinia indica TaxID=2692584 RepID=UPI00135A7785|nr:glycoside hydrolase family 16 protein [Sunxiuqinia indica]